VTAAPGSTGGPATVYPGSYPSTATPGSGSGYIGPNR
jgi:hypothetical protein